MRPTEGMSIVITGGGSGLGACMSRWFCARGARVTIIGRRKDKLDLVCAAAGPHCAAVVGDITCAADRSRLIERAVAHGGGIDALINNAGNMYRGELQTLDETALHDIFNSNVISAMLLSGLAVPELEKRRGAIIFTGSIHNRRCFPGASPYAATKGAVETLSRVLAAELGPRGIRVNCIAPGAVFTELNQRAGLSDDDTARARLQAMVPLHPLGRVGEPEEIAEAVDYLIRAEWTTGAVLDVDGGLGLGATGF